MWQMGGLGPMAGQNHHFNALRAREAAVRDRPLREGNHRASTACSTSASRAATSSSASSTPSPTWPPIRGSFPSARARTSTSSRTSSAGTPRSARGPATQRAYAKAKEVNPHAAAPIRTEEERKILFGQDRSRREVAPRRQSKPGGGAMGRLKDPDGDPQDRQEVPVRGPRRHVRGRDHRRSRRAHRLDLATSTPRGWACSRRRTRSGSVVEDVIPNSLMREVVRTGEPMHARHHAVRRRVLRGDARADQGRARPRDRRRGLHALRPPAAPAAAGLEVPAPRDRSSPTRRSRSPRSGA